MTIVGLKFFEWLKDNNLESCKEGFVDAGITKPADLLELTKDDIRELADSFQWSISLKGKILAAIDTLQPSWKVSPVQSTSTKKSETPSEKGAPKSSAGCTSNTTPEVKSVAPEPLNDTKTTSVSPENTLPARGDEITTLPKPTSDEKTTRLPPVQANKPSAPTLNSSKATPKPPSLQSDWKSAIPLPVNSSTKRSQKKKTKSKRTAVPAASLDLKAKPSSIIPGLPPEPVHPKNSPNWKLLSKNLKKKIGAKYQRDRALWNGAYEQMQAMRRQSQSNRSQPPLPVLPSPKTFGLPSSINQNAFSANAKKDVIEKEGPGKSTKSAPSCEVRLETVLSPSPLQIYPTPTLSNRTSTETRAPPQCVPQQLATPSLSNEDKVLVETRVNLALKNLKNLENHLRALQNMLHPVDPELQPRLGPPPPLEPFDPSEDIKPTPMKRRKLRHHEEKFMGDTLRCTCCGSLFRRQADLYQHQSQYNHYGCPRCGTIFSTRSSLKEHDCPNVAGPEKKTRRARKQQKKANSKASQETYSISSLCHNCGRMYSKTTDPKNQTQLCPPCLVISGLQS